MVQRLSTPQSTITLTTLLGKGGEATVYHVAENTGMVAKLYHQPTPMHEAKLQAMLLNPPEQPATHTAIAWPTALLYRQGTTMVATQRKPINKSEFVGFLMPKISGGRSIFHIYNPVLRAQLPDSFDWLALHRTAYNLCVVVAKLHAKRYVIGDINESNILVNREALVTLVDCDSFQVREEDESKVHRCPVGKPEYTPPELQGVDFKHVDQTIQHDLFGLGVLLFQLLMEGDHPFAGVLQSKESVGRVDLFAIRKGLFPYVSQHDIAPPPAALPFQMLSPQIQTAFIRCFVEGHQHPYIRPTGREWQKILSPAIKTLRPCPTQKIHVYSNHLSDCPWCNHQQVIAKKRPSQLRKTPSYRHTLTNSPQKFDLKALPTYDHSWVMLVEVGGKFLGLVGLAVVMMGIMIGVLLEGNPVTILSGILAMVAVSVRFAPHLLSGLWIRDIWSEYHQAKQLEAEAQSREAKIIAMWQKGEVQSEAHYYLIYQYADGLRVREEIDYLNFYTAYKVGDRVDTLFVPPDKARLRVF